MPEVESLWAVVILTAIVAAILLIARSAAAPALPAGATFGRAHYEVYRLEILAAGGWRWRLRAANGEVVATSGQSFRSRAEAARAIDAVRRACASEIVEILPDTTPA